MGARADNDVDVGWEMDIKELREKGVNEIEENVAAEEEIRGQVR